MRCWGTWYKEQAALLSAIPALLSGSKHHMSCFVVCLHSRFATIAVVARGARRVRDEFLAVANFTSRLNSIRQPSFIRNNTSLHRLQAHDDPLTLCRLSSLASRRGMIRFMRSIWKQAPRLVWQPEGDLRVAMNVPLGRPLLHSN